MVRAGLTLKHISHSLVVFPAPLLLPGPAPPSCPGWPLQADAQLTQPRLHSHTPGTSGCEDSCPSQVLQTGTEGFVLPLIPDSQDFQQHPFQSQLSHFHPSSLPGLPPQDVDNSPDSRDAQPQPLLWPLGSAQGLGWEKPGFRTSQLNPELVKAFCALSYRV